MLGCMTAGPWRDDVLKEAGHGAGVLQEMGYRVGIIEGYAVAQASTRGMLSLQQRGP